MKVQDCSDKELVELVTSGSGSAIQYLLMERCGRVFKHIQIDTFQGQYEFKDIVHDFYLYLQERDWKKLRDFKYQTSLYNWIKIIAIRYFYRRKKALTNNGLPLKEGSSFPHDDYTQKQLSKFEILDLFKILKDKESLVMKLSEIEGWEIKEIAEKLGTTENNIYIIRSRAKHHLKEILSKNI